ncbi:MAG: ABC transporter ATP-binding protein [Ilumatobacter sp.]|uniref:ABC transporter ATP-binding protein n=1 Tax=Ilumatobacter sp. TaxID=1967498 RepID=UPI002621675B|nr:ABC transporter ATP-binding protein [Ilumatobacter sp.]MDJ0769806.1 ABC transporter ATP-binding protein [Ilumatobacter sp.]
MTQVELRDVTVEKGGSELLRGADLVAEAGTVVGIVGSSGSGKTTLLRAVAGLDQLARGAVLFDHTDVTATQPGERNIAMVFQQAALYPHRNARRNISFPLEMRHAALEEIRRRVGAEARALHIETILERSPDELSAGEVQMVQVARAMVRSPAVLLLDEPFAHLDAERTMHLRRELLMIQRGFGVTALVATNDPVDAMTMTDRIAVIERGRITQVGAPLDVYDDPQTAAAAFLTGDADVLEVTVTTDRDGSWLEHGGFKQRAWQPALRRHAHRRLQMVVRPEWWQLDPNGTIEVDVDRVHRRGGSTLLWCRVGGRPMTVTLAGSAGPMPQDGDRVRLHLDRYVLLDPLDGRRLDLG